MDPDEEEDEIEGGVLVQDLQRAWVTEKGAPDILDYKEDIVKGLIELVNDQEASAQEHANDTTTHQFLFNVYQMEIGRLKYMLSAYLRTRLWKIEKYAIHLLDSDVLKGRLSPSEIRYAQEYRKMLETHMKHSCLSSLPDSFQKVDVTKPGDNMVPAPDTKSYVFCVVHEEGVGDIVVGSEGSTITLEKNDLVLLQYQYVEPLVREGRVALW